jgi:hypothetical protein
LCPAPVKTALGNNAMTSVKTPDGEMNVASSLRSNGAVFIDLMLAVFLAQILVGFLQILKLHLENAALIAVLAIIVFGYPIVARRGTVPSFGNWVFGTRRYPYSSIEGYSGKGELVVFEPLKNGEYSRRTIMAAVVFGVLIAALAFLASRVSS